MFIRSNEFNGNLRVSSRPRIHQFGTNRLNQGAVPVGNLSASGVYKIG